jgi:polysaccharide deacetylase family protein (PEP-CTERM system associated)
MQDKIYNFLTLDVEEWFDAEIPRRNLTNIPDDNTPIEEQIDLYLDICNRLNVKSTCFVIGKLAENKPHLVRKLHENGHEIASHSYAHKLVYSMSPTEFRKDLHKSISTLENLTGEKVKGFRAPSWSVNAKIADWFYKILEEESLIYSSSVYPAQMFLYGMPEAPQYIHRAGNTSLMEIPQQLLNFRVFSAGFAGGTYLRLLPSNLIKWGIRLKNKQGNPVFIYLHPWELTYQKYSVNLSFIERIIQYWGVKRNAEKITSVCKKIAASFERMDKFIEAFNPV